MLLLELITRKVPFLGKKLEESQVLFIYRYISLFMTSTFYFLNQPEHSVIKKIFIIGCLAIAAIILSYLYLIIENSKDSINSDRNIKLLLFIETISNSVLLIPTGGINSPFIWYTLNTILISSVFLKKSYSWIILLTYLFNYSLIIQFATDGDLDIIKFIREQSNLLLSFIMIIAAVQAWNIFIKRIKDKNKSLEEVNIQLESANHIIIESFDHIKALYQSVNILSNQGNKEGLIKLLFEHVKNITRTDTVFYYDISDDTNRMISDGKNYSLKSLEENIATNLKDILEYKVPKELCISGTRFIIVTLKSNYADYGVLGLEATDNKESILYKNNIIQLQFLSELVSTAFERFYLEEINERLLITEEQNRIANEIHDSVLQRLFSMSCGVFSLIKKLKTYSPEEMENELNLIRKTTDTVMKEIRAKIYGLSWKKSGYNSFSIDIKKYIYDIKKFTNVNIPFSIIGSEELLSWKQKKALYRIICEGIGNAVHHGEARNIDVSLDITSPYSVLSIIDDGMGFDTNKVNEDKTKGLGIQNLYQLTEFLHGEIKFDSKLGEGSTIKVRIPNNIVQMKGDKLLYENTYR